jgi:uncharacterized protein YndB with AHSA1/START domain
MTAGLETRENHVMGKTEIVAEPNSHAIAMRREFAAPREFLFRAHTDPTLLVQWLGPRELTVDVDRFEVRDGGRWRYISRDANGGEYGFRGVFHGTPSVDGIVQTFEFEGMPGHVCLESLRFEEHDGRTILHAQSVFQSVADRDGMIASGMETGVDEGYEQLDELIAREGAGT